LYIFNLRCHLLSSDMLVENIHNLLINANSEADEQNLQSVNFALLPDIGTSTNSGTLLFFKTNNIKSFSVGFYYHIQHTVCVFTVVDIDAAVEKERSRTSSGGSFRSTSSSRK